jgi:ABC-type glutathione transport system ATPase component
LSSRAAQADPLLRLQDLVVEYPTAGGNGWRPVVDGLSLEIHAGERVGLVGESGSGKSVAALACIGLVREPGRIRRGLVSVAGVDLAAMRCGCSTGRPSSTQTPSCARIPISCRADSCSG